MATSSSSNNKKVSLKLLIDKKAGKVLFGEAGKDFVDFLFHIFTLPLGSVMRLLSKAAMSPGAGCLGKLYGSIEELSDDYIQPSAHKNSVLNPPFDNRNTSTPLLLGDDSRHSAPTKRGKLYGCSKFNLVGGRSGFGGSVSEYCDGDGNVSDDPRVVCPKCKVNKMDRALRYVAVTGEASKEEEEGISGGGGFVRGVVTYMIMDDLQVKPMSSISSITLLNTFKVKDLGDLEEKVVHLGTNEGLKLLKASLESSNVLTSVFMPNFTCTVSFGTDWARVL